MKKLLLILPILVLSILSSSTLVRAEQMCTDSQDGKSKPCWEVNLIWSLRDSGMVEREIQREWKQIDLDWPHTGLFACTRTGGRSCAMQYAIDAAKKKFDDKAFRIAVSTQLHNGPAADTIRQAGPGKVADWLRSH